MTQIMRPAKDGIENSAPYPSCLVGQDTITPVYEKSSDGLI